MQTLYAVGTVTNAMRAKQILADHGIRAYVRRKRQTNGQTGCGYEVVVSRGTPDVWRWLSEGGVKVIDHERRDGP